MEPPFQGTFPNVYGIGPVLIGFGPVWWVLDLFGTGLGLVVPKIVIRLDLARLSNTIQDCRTSSEYVGRLLYCGRDCGQWLWTVDGENEGERLRFGCIILRN
jgi:hypothetical protein